MRGSAKEAGSTKVRKGVSQGHHDELTPRVVAAWAERWGRVVAPVTGCADYEALRQAVGSAGPRAVG